MPVYVDRNAACVGGHKVKLCVEERRKKREEGEREERERVGEGRVREGERREGAGEATCVLPFAEWSVVLIEQRYKKIFVSPLKFAALQSSKLRELLPSHIKAFLLSGGRQYPKKASQNRNTDK